MATSCPECGRRVRATIVRIRPQPQMPEFTTVTWDCPSCGWRSDPDGFVGSPGEGSVEAWLTTRPEADAGEDPAMLLTVHERAVVRLIAQGLSNQEIADSLVVSVNTVKSTVRTVYRKMGVETRTRAILWAFHHGLAPDDGG